MIVKVTLENGDIKYVINSDGMGMCFRMYPKAKSIELIPGEVVNGASLSDDSELLLRICQALEVDEVDLAGRTRGVHKTSLKRQAVCYRLRMANWTFADIGKLLNRDHTSIMHAFRRAQKTYSKFDNSPDCLLMAKYIKALEIDALGEANP